MFDLAADPGEMKDIAAQHPEIVAKLKKHYDTWFDEVMADGARPDVPAGQVPAAKPSRD